MEITEMPVRVPNASLSEDALTAASKREWSMPLTDEDLRRVIDRIAEL